VISAGLNVVIDPIFILGWGPVPALETRGAGIATFISRAVAAGAGLYVLLDGSWGIRMRIGDLRPDRAVLWRLVDVGYPATLDGLTRSLAAVAVAALVARFGAIATAAYGIVLRLMSVTWTISGAVGQAAATGVGQNLGASQQARAARVTWVGTAGTMVVLGALAAVVLAVPAGAMRVFTPNAAVIAEGVEFLWIVAPFWAFLGGLMVVQGAFRGAGSTRAAFVLSLLSRWAFRIPVAWLLAYPLAWGENGLWWSFSVSGVATFVVGVLWFRRGTWREGVREDGESAGQSVDPDAVDD
ncbi:MAG: MATE family efflux transporter, partial [Halobacteriales archaeon]